MVFVRFLVGIAEPARHVRTDVGSELDEAVFGAVAAGRQDRWKVITGWDGAAAVGVVLGILTRPYFRNARVEFRSAWTRQCRIACYCPVSSAVGRHLVAFEN